MLKHTELLLCLFASVVLSTGCERRKATPHSVQIGDTVAEVIAIHGAPEHQCKQTGLSSGDPDERVFGLQWGIDPDGPVLPGDIRDSDLTVWFNRYGEVVDITE